MSERRPTVAWSTEDIDRVLALLPVFEREGFQSAMWREGAAFPTYQPAVDTLFRLQHESSAWIHPYEVLPEDPPGTEPGLGTAKVLEEPSSFASATLDQIRRYLALLARAERFCDGAIASAFDSGRMLAALRRLRELRAKQ